MLKISFTTESTKKLPLYMAEDVDICSSGDRNKKIQRSSDTSNLNKRTSYLNSSSKKAFTWLRQAFIQELIFSNFDSGRHILIKIYASGYVTGEILSQLSPDNLGRWYLVAYFLRKIILAKR